MNLESDGVPEAMNEALSIPRILNDLARDKVDFAAGNSGTMRFFEYSVKYPMMTTFIGLSFL